jgi:hypothetical protein
MLVTSSNAIFTHLLMLCTFSQTAIMLNMCKPFNWAMITLIGKLFIYMNFPIFSCRVVRWKGEEKMRRWKRDFPRSHGEHRVQSGAIFRWINLDREERKTIFNFPLFLLLRWVFLFIFSLSFSFSLIFSLLSAFLNVRREIKIASVENIEKFLCRLWGEKVELLEW